MPQQWGFRPGCGLGTLGCGAKRGMGETWDHMGHKTGLNLFENTLQKGITKVNNIWLVVWNMIFFFHKKWDNPSHWLICFKIVLVSGFVFSSISAMDLDVDFSDDEPSRPFVSMPPRCKDWYYLFWLLGWVTGCIQSISSISQIWMI
jgi:hypothetical protein